MPGFVLHQGASVLCVHGGQAMPASPNPRVKVGGQMIAVQGGMYSVAACPFTTPGGTPQPCVTASWVVAAVRVKSLGMAVLLQDSQSITTPNAVPLQVMVTQTRARGM